MIPIHRIVSSKDSALVPVVSFGSMLTVLSARHDAEFALLDTVQYNTDTDNVRVNYDTGCTLQ